MGVGGFEAGGQSGRVGRFRGWVGSWYGLAGRGRGDGGGWPKVGGTWCGGGGAGAAGLAGFQPEDAQAAAGPQGVAVVDRPDPQQAGPRLGSFGPFQEAGGHRNVVAAIADGGLGAVQEAGRPVRVGGAAPVAADDQETAVRFGETGHRGAAQMAGAMAGGDEQQGGHQGPAHQNAAAGETMDGPVHPGHDLRADEGEGPGARHPLEERAGHQDERRRRPAERRGPPRPPVPGRCGVPGAAHAGKPRSI